MTKNKPHWPIDIDWTPQLEEELSNGKEEMPDDEERTDERLHLDEQSL